MGEGESWKYELDSYGMVERIPVEMNVYLSVG